MNLKGNAFSLGAGRTVSAVKRDGVCHIFMRRSGPVSYVRFNPAARAMNSVNAFISYGDYCRVLGGVLVEYADGQVSYADVQ